MPVITDITVQQRHKDRVNIFVDGEFACAMEQLSAMKFRLKIGKEIDQATLLDSVFDSECSSAFGKSIDYLARGLKTISQMTKYILGKGYSNEVAKVVVDKLVGYRYLSDEQFVASYVSAHSSTKGKRRLVVELQQKGISRQLCDSIELDSDTTLYCATAVAKKYMRNKCVDVATLAKLQRHLISRGYDYDTVGSIISSYRENI